MFTKSVAFFAILAAVNAGVILTPSARFADATLTKTIIKGPSGEITQEEHAPVISHEVQVKSLPLARELVVPVQRYIQPEAPVLVRKEIPLVPQVRLVNPLLPTSRVLVKSVPHTIPYVTPLHVVPNFYKSNLYY